MNPHLNHKKRGILILGVIILILAAVIASFLMERNSLLNEDSGTVSTSQEEPPITYPPLPPQTENESDPDDSESVFSPPSALSWESKNFSNRYECDGELLLLTYITHPILSGLDQTVADRIHIVLSSFCEEFVRITSDDRILAEEAYEGEPFSFESLERAGDYTVFVRDNVISIHYSLFYDNGGANSRSEQRAFISDLTTGDVLPFSRYIGTDEAFGREYIIRVTDQMIAHYPEQFYTDAMDILRETVSLTDYYLTEEALILFYNPGILAPGALGLITLPIPYPELNK